MTFLNIYAKVPSTTSLHPWNCDHGRKDLFEQEYIPVGCVLLTAVAVMGGSTYPHTRSMHPPDQTPPQDHPPGPDPPVDRQTHVKP